MNGMFVSISLVDVDCVDVACQCDAIDRFGKHVRWILFAWGKLHEHSSQFLFLPDSVILDAHVFGPLMKFRIP